MNFTTITGFVAAGFVVWYGVLAPSANPHIFLDSHALILVLGGTIAAAMIAFPLKQFRELLSFVFLGALFPPKRQFSTTVEQILALYNRQDTSLLKEAGKIHPYLYEGYLLMIREELSSDELKMILHSRHQRFKERYSWDAKTLLSLAKFPPAFGLLGATTGMIAMMSGLGPDGRDSIGPAMAVALVATFWGIGLANFIILPLADHAQKINADDARLRLMISTGLVLIHQRVAPSMLLEHLISFLPVNERLNPRFNQLVYKAKNGNLAIAGADNKPA